MLSLSEEESVRTKKVSLQIRTRNQLCPSENGGVPQIHPLFAFQSAKESDRLGNGPRRIQQLCFNILSFDQEAEPTSGSYLTWKIPKESQMVIVL